MSTVSTHVLDAARGEPARGIVVRLERVGKGELGRAITDADGRVSGFGVAGLKAGDYRLVFETGSYLTAHGGQAGAAAFFPEVVITFTVDGQRPKYHLPLLLSPFSYSTYRGS